MRTKKFILGLLMLTSAMVFLTGAGFGPRTPTVVNAPWTFTGGLTAQCERSFDLALSDAWIKDEFNIVDDYAGLTERSDRPSIPFKTTEASVCQWSFRLPSNYKSGLGLRIWADSTATDNEIFIAWSENASGEVIDVATTAETSVSFANYTTANNIVFNIPCSNALASMSEGSWVGLDLYSGTGSGTMYIKGIEVYYTATQ
jgi:hypothetical protein